jgi:hypothetical protein
MRKGKDPEPDLEPDPDPELGYRVSLNYHGMGSKQ